MRYHLYSLLLLLFMAHSAFCQKRYSIHNEAEFKEAALKVRPGETIVIANGTYKPWAITFMTSGTAEKQIRISAETKGKVAFSGEVNEPVFKIKANHVTVSGIRFIECNLNKANGKSGVLIELDSTLKSRVSDCVFERNVARSQFMPLVIVGGQSTEAVVENCRFDANVDNQDIQVKVTKDTAPQHTLIRNNTFTNKKRVSWPNDNGGECIQVGQDPILLGNKVSNTVVANNRFMACSPEPEVISNKCSGNVYQNNYFENCDAELVMRGGHDCLIDSNRFTGGMGIRINGSGHRITNNLISNVSVGIRLNYGMSKGRTETGFYVAATNCKVINNTITNTNTGILIGDGKDEDWTGKFDTKRYPSRTIRDVPPADNVVENNHFDKTEHTVVHQ